MAPENIRIASAATPLARAVPPTKTPAGERHRSAGVGESKLLANHTRNMTDTVMSITT